MLSVSLITQVNTAHQQKHQPVSLYCVVNVAYSPGGNWASAKPDRNNEVLGKGFL